MLTKEANTEERRGQVRGYKVKGGEKIFKGALVVIDAGLACKGKESETVFAAGRATQTIDATDAADGDYIVLVEEGVFGWDNKADDALTSADIGKDCYVFDDHTVADTAASRSVAGRIVDVDSKVWVRTAL